MNIIQRMHYCPVRWEQQWFAAATRKMYYTYIKHFALNDQETNAIGGANWCNEQAMREIYLKPFELSVKEGESKAIMTTWSRNRSNMGSKQTIVQNVLRDEWGFERICQNIMR